MIECALEHLLDSINRRARSARCSIKGTTTCSVYCGAVERNANPLPPPRQRQAEAAAEEQQGCESQII